MATITKLGEQAYNFHLHAPTREIDENVNDEQLLGLLVRETLMNHVGEVIYAEFVMARLDAIHAGEQVNVVVVDRPLA